MTQSRIAARFAAAQNRKLFIPYITAGDPDLGTTLAMMHTLVDAGADIIELGVPFSDPMADGPVVQAACERALINNVSLMQVLDIVKQFRETNNETAVVLMGYLNPVETLGYERFATLAAEVGVDGVLTVDMPPEEAAELVHELRTRDIDAIFLLSPTTPDARLQSICDKASGFLYYVSLKGVTGAATLDVEEVAARVAHVKTFTSIPVAVGFGIRDAKTAAAISQAADAVVVGSTLVSLVAEYGTNASELHVKLKETAQGMRQAMDQMEVAS